MATFMAVPRRDAHQPFQCSICQRGFTRKENLKRHAALHSHRGIEFPCESCPATFSRRDLRQRHMKKKHQSQNSPRLSCRRGSRPGLATFEDSTSPESDSSTASPSAVAGHWHVPPEDGEDIEALFRQTVEKEPPTNDVLQQASIQDIDIQYDHEPGPSPARDSWFPTASQISAGHRLYFDHVSPFIPFLHEPTFDAARAPSHLTLAILSLAYQHGEDPDTTQAESSGLALSVRCFEAARAHTDAATHPESDVIQNLHLVQSLLMLQLCSILYLCGNYSTRGFEMHHRMVAFARSAGLMTPSNIETIPTEDLNSLWQQFAMAESLKRTILTAHQVDALWYQFLSIPRLVSNPEIKHDLPCPAEIWTASTAQQWAHRQLVMGNSKARVRYGDAVRSFLAPDASTECLPNFDPCGAINIAQFLLSSARELSGWAIMTGRLSLERFEPLKASLIALEPFVRSSSASPHVCQSISSQAAWEMSMIELPVWWISHTNGVVLGSMNAFLEHATWIAASSEFCSESETAKSIKPHIEWFLCYLDGSTVRTSEPPWLVLYAYKAFLIAWQLLDSGLPEAMEVVSVHDRAEALLWAKKVFKRRKPLQLVRTITQCLEMLQARV